MPKFGFLRETSEDAAKVNARRSSKNFTTGLDEYLKLIFPETNDWIHDQVTGIDKLGKRRPDYRSESLKLVVEFDGLPHYTSPKTISADLASTKLYRECGYKCIWIPFFIQLTRSVIKMLFNVDVPKDADLLDEQIVSFDSNCTQAFMCTEGMYRCASELTNFETQLIQNIGFLETLPLNISGLEEFSKILKIVDTKFEYRTIEIFGLKKTSGGRNKASKIVENDCAIRAIHKLTNKSYDSIKADLDKLDSLIHNRYEKNTSDESAGYSPEVIRYYMINTLGYKYIDASDTTYFDLILDTVSYNLLAYIPLTKKALLVLDKHVTALIDDYIYELEKPKYYNNEPFELDITGMFIPCENKADYIDSTKYDQTKA